MAASNPITIKKLARKLGLATSTVSYALRNSPEVSPETCLMVQQTAQSLGYRPNPRIASLMAHIRRAQTQALTDSIAFVWIDCDRAECAHAPFLRLLIAGARQRAEQGGYKIEEFWLSDPGMTTHRIHDILRAQGIVGLIFSAATTHSLVDLHFDISSFSASVIGSATWIPELHRASHHHYEGMRLCLQKLTALGYRKPFAILKRKLNDRCHHSYEAAFLTHAPQARANRFLRIVDGVSHQEVSAWIRLSGADCLIVSSSDFVGAEPLRALQKKEGIPVATLYREPSDSGFYGIDQCYDLVAAKAVDLVITQLNHNEYGAPEVANTLHFPGKWICPTRKTRA